MLLEFGRVLFRSGFGGYITFYYPQGIGNMVGEYDFRVLGNAFANNAEPGVIMVMKDENGNGLPDDTWYEIWGSEHDHAETNTDYSITYYKPTAEKEAESLPTDYIYWQDSEGSNGYLPKNRYHSQSYWPGFVGRDSITFTSTRLRNNAIDVNGDGSYITFATFDYGYADNCSNSADCSQINIEWAATKEGVSVSLDTIHFIKIATGINQCYGNTGEVSTEVGGITLVARETSLETIIEDKHMVFYAHGMLHIENAEGGMASLYSINGTLLQHHLITESFFQRDLSNLDCGIYLVRIDQGEKVSYHKIIKK